MTAMAEHPPFAYEVPVSARPAEAAIEPASGRQTGERRMLPLRLDVSNRTSSVKIERMGSEHWIHSGANSKSVPTFVPMMQFFNPQHSVFS